MMVKQAWRFFSCFYIGLGRGEGLGKFNCFFSFHVQNDERERPVCLMYGKARIL